MSDHPGQVGKYRIEEPVGRGNMGVVYRAYDPFAHRRVAVKLCPLADDIDPITARRARKMFFNEAHTAGALDHPNILRIFDAGEEEGEPYIVMEFVPGGRTLKPHTSPEGLLPLPAVARCLHQAARALDYAHRRGVIHRDIKSSNIMLGERDEAKIGDFGVAHYALSDATQLMGIVGSPRYLSPEQAREDELTHQTDLYSLGVVAYELLTGQPPFKARGISRLVMKILHEEALPPSRVREGLPAAWDAVVARALAKQPADRFPSGQAFATALAPLLDSAPARARPPDPTRTWRTARDLPFFNEFSDPELEEVLKLSVWEPHAAGERVVSEGAGGESFYVLVAGEVAVLKGEREIGRLAPGDCFGEMAYIARRPRSATVVAREDVVVLRVDAEQLDRASSSCQLRFSRVFLRTLVERLERTSEQLSRRAGPG